MDRREFLNGAAGVGAFAALPGIERSLSGVAARGGEHHPGPPRFMQVGERLADPAFSDGEHGYDRDDLAPRIPDPARNPTNYDAEDFRWSVTTRPEGSSAGVTYAPSPYGESQQYDSGRHNTAAFEPDVPGRYVLELDAPDGTYRQTIRVFPAPSSAAAGPPRISLDATLEGDEFVVESNPELAPDSTASRSDLIVEFLPDDRASLSAGDVTVEGTTARVPASAIEKSVDLHAAAFDGDRASVTDTVTLDAADGEVGHPTHPPGWLEEGVMYEIFTRSFAGEKGATDFAFLREKVRYLADLGIDVVWLTPVVPAVSSNVIEERPPGGPHGYDAIDYFDVASDLGTLEGYRAFVRECHDHGIRVCFDFVVNHAGRDHPFFQDTIESQADEPPFEGWMYPAVEAWNADSQYFDWFDRVAEPLVVDGKTIEPEPYATAFFGYRVMPNLDYATLALREHVLAVADFWSGEVGVDAFRCDVAWGVPHSFWKEVRDLVRENDAEFLLVDETIPNDPSFAADEFGAHFDTADFLTTARKVARGSLRADRLYESVAKRTEEGFPEHTLLVNAIENHDEPRVLRTALDLGIREDPAKAQRAAFAASITLPGVPFVYYGQERQISKHGTNRHNYDGGADDDPRDGDVGPGTYQRAFMNWEADGATVPEDHLEFYRRLIGAYHRLDVLKPGADLRREWYRPTSGRPFDLLVFGRAATDRNAVVVVNFGADAATLDLRPAVDSGDLLSGEDLATATDRDRTTVEVGTVAVFEAASLSTEAPASDPASATDTTHDGTGTATGGQSGFGIAAALAGLAGAAGYALSEVDGHQNDE